MKTIVVPTDFSDISLNAVNYAADLAMVTGTRLMLIHVCTIPVAVNEIAVPAYNSIDMLTAAEERMELLKNDVQLRTDGRIQVYSNVLEGDPITVIQRYCQDIDLYAVVMGTEGGSSAERFLFGGKTLSAVRHFAWPVIAVPPGVQFTGWNKVGLATDLEDIVHSIPVAILRNIVQHFKASLHVINIRPEDINTFKDEGKEGTSLLYTTLKDLYPQYHYIRDKNVEASICNFSENNHLDLLIIVPKSHDLFDRIIHHSHSKRIVLQTHVPVMAVHE